MLGTTLWFVTALGVLTMVLLDAAAIFGRAGVTAAANHAVESGENDALADFQNRLQVAIATFGAATVQPGATSAPMSRALPPIDYAAALAAIPSPLDGRSLGDAGSAPPFSIAYSVVPTTGAMPICTPGAANSGADAVAWLQCAAVVQESRISLRITVDVSDASGMVHFAHRDAYVALRLFADPPYSAPIGRKDADADAPAADDALAPPAHEGDIGGDTVSGETPPPAVPWPAGGTLIHVRYACSDGAGRCANAYPPDPDAALRSGARWTDGNVPVP